MESYKKAQAAISGGLFKNEICGVEISSKAGTQMLDTDEEPGKARFDKMPELRPPLTKKEQSPRPMPQRSMTEQPPSLFAQKKALKTKA